jgi:hypothetical protein
MADMFRKVRCNSKLLPIDVLRIRYANVSENRKASHIRIDGISERTIRRVLQKDEKGNYQYYTHWRHLPEPPESEDLNEKHTR